jgi:hypothetical protein
MKYYLVIASLVLGLSACSFVKPHEKTTQALAQQTGLVEVHKSQFDASFILPGTNFGQYKKIILSDLDLTSTKIIKPSSPRAFEEAWELDKDDRKYYQEKYTESASRFLFDSAYSLSDKPAADTLVLKTKITEIAPLASKDDFKSRPNLIDVYSQGFGRMTITFELYDSVSNKLVAIDSDEHDLGQIWEKNNRAQNNMQIKLAFDYWLRNLKRELETVNKK